MTQKSIEEQVEILRSTGKKFSASRKAASEFLRSAGIVSAENGEKLSKNVATTESSYANHGDK